MTKSLQLYFIALVPPKNIREEVLDFQRLAEEKFNSKVTLRSPVHLTLVPPFKASLDELKQISKKITGCLKNNHRPLATTITGFYHFSNRVIMLEVSKTIALEVLFTDIMLAASEITYNHGYTKFVPHITIANRDLIPEVFDKAYEYFSHIPYSRNFIADEIAIFSFDHGTWSAIKQFSL
jgi:2'-5' RNA ligase